MKSYQPIAVCAVLFSAALVSCETNRVNERPLGFTPKPAPPSVSAAPSSNSGGRSLLDDIQGSGPSLNSAGSGVSDPAQDSNSGTISRLLNDIGLPSGNPTAANNPAPANNLLNPSSPIAPPQPAVRPAPVPSADIPTAWAIPGDPTIVRSPYDSNKKIRVVNKAGVPYPSGTILRDTNFPNEIRKFRVP